MTDRPGNAEERSGREDAQHPSGAGRPVALVTGATRGIGRAIARDLARTHRVIVGGRDERSVDALVAELGDAVPFVADLTDEPTVEAAIARLGRLDGLDGRGAGRLDGLDGRGAGRLDGLDVVVHSAGIIGPVAPVAELDRAAYRDNFELNVIAVAALTRALLPALRARRGLVVMMNSGSGLHSGPRVSVYCAAKFALLALTDSLRAEERPHGVRVTSIHPGRVGTDMQRQLRAAEGGAYEAENYLEPHAVAAAVRLAVDTPPSGSVESLTVRPAG